MTTVTSHEPGTFCWVELGTSDANAARSFYTQLFGWDVKEVPMGEEGTYYLFQNGGRDAAAMYQIGPAQQGMPPNWASYVSVANVDESAEKVKSLGGTLMMPPFDVFDMGRMAVFTDPQGAALSMWQSKQNTGVGVHGELNSLCWNELQTRGAEAAKQFYASLFGWSYKGSAEYNEIYMGDRAIGGIMETMAPPSVPPYWMPYFAVADCDATVAKAQSLGATVHVPPMDIPNAGRFSVMTDGQGAVFAVIKVIM